MENILILPDIHGRKFWEKPCRTSEDYDKIVFLGDYLDDYPDEGYNDEQVIENFEAIIDLKLRNKNKVVLLIGNHDLSYIDFRAPKCRFDYLNAAKIDKMFSDNKDLFQVAYQAEQSGKNFVFSHCGIEMYWFDYIKSAFNVELDKSKPIEELNRLYLEGKNILPFTAMTFYRGGYDAVSSCMWGDVREFDLYINNESNEQLEGVYQIFAHTQLIDKPIITDKYACLDVRRPFLLRDGIIMDKKDEENV